MKIPLLILLTLISFSSAASTLENQLRTLEASKIKIEVQQKSAISEIDNIIYDGYIKSASLTIEQPIIQSVNDNMATVKIQVAFKISDQAILNMRNTINNYLEVQEDEDELSYLFNSLCYEKIQCFEPLTLKTPVSPEVWYRLTTRALMIEVVFLGEHHISLVIGQTLGNSGRILKNGSYEFTMDIPKSEIKGNPMPTASLTKYKCIWDYKSPSYEKINI